jgi:hypothetical protein
VKERTRGEEEDEKVEGGRWRRSRRRRKETERGGRRRNEGKEEWVERGGRLGRKRTKIYSTTNYLNSAKHNSLASVSVLIYKRVPDVPV